MLGMRSRVERTVRRTIAEAPPELRRLLGRVSIEIADRPSAEDLELGVDPAIEGYFAGEQLTPEWEDWHHHPDPDDGPPRIKIFAANLRPRDPGRAVDVLLHELGHLVGLEEEELEALGAV